MSQLFSSLPNFFAFMQPRVDALAIRGEKVSLGALKPDWVVDEESVRRPDGILYKVEGIRHQAKAGGRIVNQPFITDAGLVPGPHGYIAIIVDEDGNVLIRIKGEAGNVGIPTTDGEDSAVLLCPPIQFSRSNFILHQKSIAGECDANGKPYQQIPLCHIVSDGKYILSAEHPDASTRWHKISKDGGRFYKLQNKHSAMVIRRKILEEDLAKLSDAERKDFAWVTRKLFATLILQGGLVNEHFCATTGILWAMETLGIMK